MVHGNRILDIVVDCAITFNYNQESETNPLLMTCMLQCDVWANSSCFQPIFDESLKFRAVFSFFGRFQQVSKNARKTRIPTQFRAPVTIPRIRCRNLRNSPCSGNNCRFSELKFELRAQLRGLVAQRRDTIPYQTTTIRRSSKSSTSWT